MISQLVCVTVFLIFGINVDTQHEPTAVSRRPFSGNMFTNNGKMYYVDSIFQTNFYRAMQFCRQKGMHLLSITSIEENDFIGDWVKDHGYILNRYWTSAANIGDRKQWIWLSTGNDITYFKWYPGEPNKYDNKENCIEVGWFGTAGFTWNDLECLRTDKHFICEASTECYNLVC